MSVEEIFFNFANENNLEFCSDGYIEKDCCFYNDYNHWAGFAQFGDKDLFNNRVIKLKKALKDNGITYKILKCKLDKLQWVFKIEYND